jgi:hypothetical protein
MIKYRFYKKDELSWYIDLPEYPGNIDDLMMVAGADKMLDQLAKDSNEVMLHVSEVKFPGSRTLKLTGLTGNEGANYMTGNDKIWLCGVTEYVFGYYPKQIFFKIANRIV